MKLSVVIPARDEGRNIGDTLAALQSHLDGAQIDHEIVMVDDGSSDDTAAVVRGLAERDPRIRLVRNAAPHGFGRAVRRGIEAVTGEATVICMADGSDDPRDVVRYHAILRDRAECAFGSRFIAGAAVHNYPPHKYVLNRLANWFIKVLFGLPYNDVTNAFKGYRSYVLRGCQPILSPHFNLTVELPLKAIVRGYSYEVVPISWRNRRFGVSSLKIQEMGSRYLFIVLHIWLEKLLVGVDYRRTDRPPAPTTTASPVPVVAASPAGPAAPSTPAEPAAPNAPTATIAPAGPASPLGQRRDNGASAR